MPALHSLGALNGGLSMLKRQGFVPDLVIYNAGMDPYSRLDHDASVRENLVFDHLRDMRLPIAFVLAGGYLGPSLDQAELVALHRFTIQAAVGGVIPPL